MFGRLTVTLNVSFHNTGGGNDTASYVTPTTDKVWLLSEFEVFGTRYIANSAVDFGLGNLKARRKPPRVVRVVVPAAAARVDMAEMVRVAAMPR